MISTTRTQTHRKITSCLSHFRSVGDVRQCDGDRQLSERAHVLRAHRCDLAFVAVCCHFLSFVLSPIRSFDDRCDDRKRQWQRQRLDVSV